MGVDEKKVERFIYTEALYMDENRYDEWFALWAEDLLYWVPANIDDADPATHVQIIYDDRSTLEDRIERLKGGVAHAQDPKSRMRRLISNVEVEEESNGDVRVASNFNLTEIRHGKQDTFAGRTFHHLRPAGDSFKMVSKKVLLVNNDEVIDNLTFLI